MDEPTQPIFRSQDVPRSPGVYVYRNKAGEVIYVGKARNLRRRMSSYFRPSGENKADPKRRALIHSIASYEIFQVATEAEALLLETQFIKQYAPRYNILMRDDKRFLHIKVDMAERFPRLQLARIRRDDGCVYIGPFPQTQDLRETVRFLAVRFGLRTCQTPEPDMDTRKHCLEHVIRFCLCPCSGNVTPETYAEHVSQVLALFRGEGAPALISELSLKMKECADKLDFEQAASLRDVITSLKSVLEPARRFVNQTMLTRSLASNPEGMQALQDILALETLPRHMECFDMSNISGSLAVGSMVFFKDGKPDTSQYRRFKIRSDTATDDTAFMAEVLERRYSRLLRENAPLPDLIVLDGGETQLAAATRVFAAINMPPVPYIGLAKQLELIVLPGPDEPILLPRDNPGLKLLQAIRDEAHRFANGFHRELRNRRIFDSILDDIPGIGKTRRTQLLKVFGSVRELARHSPREIADKVPGIGIDFATKIIDFLNQRLKINQHREDNDDN